MTKECKKCGAIKPLDEFYGARGTRDGHRGACKACESVQRSEWYRKNRDQVIEKVRSWQHENRDRYLARQREYKRANPKRERSGYLRRSFGITLADYDEMLVAQGGGCAVCGRPRADGQSLHVDHDHENGRVRGLLCFKCNGGLGQFRDDPELLSSAVAYLARSDELHDVIVERARGLSQASG